MFFFSFEFCGISEFTNALDSGVGKTQVYMREFELTDEGLVCCDFHFFKITRVKNSRKPPTREVSTAMYFLRKLVILFSYC